METKERKRAVLKTAKPTGKQDSYGNYSFALEFDNGDSGFLSSKNDQIGSLGFVVNQAVDYDIEKKVSQKGTEYFKIYKPKPEFNGNGGTKYQQKDSEVITMLSCISSACTAVAQSSDFSNTKVILLMAEDFYKAAMAKKPQ